ncbi:TPA: guanylate kinase, partial [Neisseria gonorrhoeae]
LLANHNGLRVSVSHTTRPPREGEANGVHYHFVSKEEFESLIAQEAFLEYADVFGNYYGTSTEGVNALAAAGYDVILEIDVQGAAQVRNALPEAVGIFILPPSFDVLAARLKGRGTDSREVIQRRLSKARHEIEQSVLFDFVVVNDDLEKAEGDLLHIVNACRLKRSRQLGFIADLLENS